MIAIGAESEMKTAIQMKGRLAAGALAVAMTASALATPTLAQDYRDYRGNGGDYRYGYQNNCEQIKHDRTTTGGILGALAGAAIGANLAAHGGGRAGGAVLGALAGAAVGTNVGRDTAKTSGRCGGYYRDGRYYSYPVRQSYGYRDDGRYDGRGDQYGRTYERQEYSRDNRGYRYEHYERYEGSDWDGDRSQRDGWR